mgnify:CR=1 FL=1
MMIQFHRGASNWIAAFEWDGFEVVAFFNRETGRWYWAKQHLTDLATRSELEVLLTEQLKSHIKKESP